MEVSKKSVLEGHKRKGSKFIPTVMQLPGGISEINYIKQILPHIIWMGLVNDRLGYKKGIEVSKTICEIAVKLKSTEDYVNFAVVGNFAVLSDSDKMKLVEILSSNSTLQTYQECLAPLIALYDDFPLSFLGQTDCRISHCS